MKKCIIAAGLSVAVIGTLWWARQSMPPPALMATVIGTTNHPGGWMACLVAVTNRTTNRLIVLVPLSRDSSRRASLSAFPTNLFLCPVGIEGHGNKVVTVLHTQPNQQELVLHYGVSRDFSGWGYRIRRWLRLPRGQPRDFLSNPQALVVKATLDKERK